MPAVVAAAIEYVAAAIGTEMVLTAGEIYLASQAIVATAAVFVALSIVLDGHCLSLLGLLLLLSRLFFVGHLSVLVLLLGVRPELHRLDRGVCRVGQQKVVV